MLSIYHVLRPHRISPLGSFHLFHYKRSICRARYHQVVYLLFLCCHFHSRRSTYHYRFHFHKYQYLLFVGLHSKWSTGHVFSHPSRRQFLLFHHSRFPLAVALGCLLEQPLEPFYFYTT